MTDRAVVDASAMIDLLLDAPLAAEVRRRLLDREVHAPAHMDAEVLSGLGRVNRAGGADVAQVAECLRQLSRAPIERHGVGDLLSDAWGMRENMRLADALYVALANQLGATLVTTDARLARASGAELVE